MISRNEVTHQIASDNVILQGRDVIAHTHIVCRRCLLTNYYHCVLQLSYSSASPALSDKAIYKRFYRVFPPESSFNPAKFALLRAFNWKKVGLIHQAQELFSLVSERAKVGLIHQAQELFSLVSKLHAATAART